MSEVITKTHCRAIATIQKPPRLPPSFELQTVQVNCMSPEMRVGERIWVDRQASPQDGDVVVARDTVTNRTFMGEYSRGFGGGFFIRPLKGMTADSTIHPVVVVAVVMAHLKEMRRQG